MKRKIKLKESQIKKIIEQSDDYVTSDVKSLTQELESIDCATEDLSSYVTSILESNGYENVIIKFLGKEDDGKTLIYLAYTNGPIFVYKAQSSIEDNRPCLQVVDVVGYESI